MEGDVIPNIFVKIMLTRKKSLKIQDRLGMRIGIAYGTYKKPTAKTTNDVLEVLSDLYQSGFKAFVVAPELFEKIQGKKPGRKLTIKGIKFLEEIK